MKQKKDLDMSDYGLLTAQIKIMEEDFFELQLWLEIVTFVTHSTKRVIMALLFSQQNGWV